MNNEQRTIRGFTLIELVVAVAILAIVLSFAGVIFRVSIDSQRMAVANAEIMQKLRAITDQLNADFKGLRKDGEIFVVWVAKEAVTASGESVFPYDGYRDCDNDGYERFDRIMFFADGDFQSYGPTMVRGNLARICYMLAKNRNGKRADVYRDLSLTERGRKLRDEDRRGRTLARTQHIITTALPDHHLLDSLTPDNLNRWHNIYEYDTIFLEGWKDIPWWPDKAEILTAITDIKTDGRVGDEYGIGAMVDPADANSIHKLLCEGVGEFKIQGWYDAQQRWVPEVSDSDFYPEESGWVPGILYPYRAWFPIFPDGPNPDGYVQINNISYPGQLVDEAHFYEIPGLGRALKFTFTLYDSKGVIKNGRTFTHIVYLGN